MEKQKKSFEKWVINEGYKRINERYLIKNNAIELNYELLFKYKNINNE